MSRILAVDDDSVVREALSRLLTLAGYSAVTAANGRDAWLTLYEGVPDLILLDLMMPQMDGITFLNLLRHSDHWSRVPVIVITGCSDDDELVGQARRLGITEVLPKTNCAADQVLSLVERTLARAFASHPCDPQGRRSGRGLVFGAV